MQFQVVSGELMVNTTMTLIRLYCNGLLIFQLNILHLRYSLDIIRIYQLPVQQSCIKACHMEERYLPAGSWKQTDGACFTNYKD